MGISTRQDGSTPRSDSSRSRALHCNGQSTAPHHHPRPLTNNPTKIQVLIWVGLAGGDQEYCAILVAVNSILQMILYAPMAVFFINIISRDSAINLEYGTVARSVAVFLGIPLAAAILTRFGVRKAFGAKFYDGTFMKWLGPWSLIGLLFTIIILFASQGKQVVQSIVSVVRVAAPLVVYFAIIFSATLLVSYRLGFGYKLSTVQAFTAASNNFELAIAYVFFRYVWVEADDVVVCALRFSARIVRRRWRRLWGRLLKSRC